MEKVHTVAVLGASYGGFRAAQLLATSLPNGWRVVLVERNSHLNNVYNFARYAVLPGHEHKAFIPYDYAFGNSINTDTPHIRIHGTVTSLHPNHITYIPHSFSSSSSSEPAPEPQTLHFDYLIYALGSHLPSPIDLWEHTCERAQHLDKGRYHDKTTGTGTKSHGMAWLRERQARIEAAQSVLIVGGGALGIQFASDIAAIHPLKKRVTLLHSRTQLLPRFEPALGDEVLTALQDLGVQVVLGERLDLDSLGPPQYDGTDENRTGTVFHVQTLSGWEINAEVVLLCTGQTPNTALMRDMDSRAVGKGGLIRVTRKMQVLVEDEHSEVDFGEEDHVKKATEGIPKMIESEPVSRLSSPGPSLPVPASAIPKRLVTAQLDVEPPAPKREKVKSLTSMANPNSPQGPGDRTSSSQAKRTIYPHIFAVGDAADAFGALQAGHTAYYQAEVAARNVVRLVKREARRCGSLSWSEGDGEDTEGEEELEEYTPGLPMIKVSLGLVRIFHSLSLILLFLMIILNHSPTQTDSIGL
ncbi:FAD/NAD(P)-binding domain-containing protein [Pisolithus sp. B1]|nr:FAD/NAD(P)-binding domain-containing protein [Pisolithus sp. B1]